MTTIDDVYRLVNIVANKKQYGQIRPDDFNILAPRAQMEAIMNAFGNPRTYKNDIPIPEKAASMTTKTQDDLLPLLKRDDNGGNGYTSSNNEIDYPSDYMHRDALERLNGKPIRHYLTSEIGNIRDNKVTVPDENFPACAFYSDKIRVYPDLTDIVIVYYRKPVTPKWAYTQDGTNAVYDSNNSVQFELPEDMYNEIAMNILQYIGINLGREELTQFALTKENKGV